MNEQKTSILFNGAANFTSEYKDAEFYKNKIKGDTIDKKKYLDDIAPDFLETSGLILKEEKKRAGFPPEDSLDHLPCYPQTRESESV